MAYTSAGLLALFKDTVQLGSTTQGTSDPQAYQLLENAQIRIMRIMATHVPHVNVSPPELLASGDNGLTYTFASYPIGHAEVRNGRTGPLLYPAADWDISGDGYVMEGQTIRFPGGRARTFSNGLYARYTKTPTTLNAATEPVLKPDTARLAVVYDAAVEWAMQGNSADATPYLKLRQLTLWGDPTNPGDIGIIPSLKTQYYAQGSPAVPAMGAAWWYGNPAWVGGR